MATAVSVTLHDTKVTKIPSTTTGPLSTLRNSLGGILMGRSSAGLKGIMVIPGLIDADCKGQISIMAYTISPPIFIPAGSKIAQIVAIENNQPRQNVTSPRKGGFGSTGPVACFTKVLSHRPMVNMKVSLHGLTITLSAMIDTGADITIIALKRWPSKWALDYLATDVVGVGGSTPTRISREAVTLKWDDCLIQQRVHVMPLPGTLEALIGRDVLSQLGAVVTTDKTHSFGYRPL